ncbi:hypothetical protein [Actinoplanes sp. NPDC049681]|uniref:hypothetical protein n=1 Tax=Actinoplanes sp. NPDC049681 TaxID=3363905 RepID=UPI00379AAA44
MRREATQKMPERFNPRPTRQDVREGRVSLYEYCVVTSSRLAEKALWLRVFMRDQVWLELRGESAGYLDEEAVDALVRAHNLIEDASGG